MNVRKIVEQLDEICMRLSNIALACEREQEEEILYVIGNLREIIREIQKFDFCENCKHYDELNDICDAEKCSYSIL